MLIGKNPHHNRYLEASGTSLGVQKAKRISMAVWGNREKILIHNSSPVRSRWRMPGHNERRARVFLRVGGHPKRWKVIRIKRFITRYE
jgi:hypothetical protein